MLCKASRDVRRIIYCYELMPELIILYFLTDFLAFLIRQILKFFVICCCSGAFIFMNRRYTLVSDQNSISTVKTTDRTNLICRGYHQTVLKTVLFFLTCILTCGLFLLIKRWRPNWFVFVRYKQCSLDLAEKILIFTSDGYYCLTDFKEIHFSENGPFEYQNYSSLSSSSQNSTQKSPQQKTFVLKVFDFRHEKFVWNANLCKFVVLNGLLINEKEQNVNNNNTFAQLLSKYDKGWSEDEQQERLKLFGPNSIDIEVKSYFSLFINEVLNPFYFFQLASLTLWCLDNYYIYASCIFFITILSIAVELHEIKKQSRTLSETVSTANNVQVRVRRANGDLVTMPSYYLTPGDVIQIPHDGCLMSCDCLLLNGSCIVNESMLTGESVPVTKYAVSNTELNEYVTTENAKKHVLYCGTIVLQTKFCSPNQQIYALVLKTGFSTSKGQLIRDILYPKSISFKFYRDTLYFIGILGIVALIGTGYSLYMLITYHANSKRIIIRALDIITIVVPPALPAALTVGIWYAQRRLKNKRIFCISPPRINVCGKLNLICFDKTGTLTDDGLDFVGILPSNKGRFTHFEVNPTSNFLPSSPQVTCMATCHTLAIIDNVMVGDPLELSMFYATKWELLTLSDQNMENDQNSHVITVRFCPDSDLFLAEAQEVQIIKEFAFSSNLQRSAVITRRNLHNNQFLYEIYVKGAPEKIASLCKAESIPQNFTNVLDQEAQKGHRVLAMAYRILSTENPGNSDMEAHNLMNNVKREELEHDLEFLGFILFKNKLKSETTGVIRELREARISSLMATGDNLMTALSVAFECEILQENIDSVYLVEVVDTHSDNFNHSYPYELKFKLYNYDSSLDIDHYGEKMPNFERVSSDLNYKFDQRVKFAMSGTTFDLLRHKFPDQFEKILLKSVVFARMNPWQKSKLIEALQQLGYTVGMCGDGANDCGALKIADVGISLSEAEASVASPFTSHEPSIKCVPTIIKEGRCALVTSFSVFKYMIIYGLIQFISVLVLYSVHTNFADYMFAFIDMLLITPLAILMGRNKACNVLHSKRPHSRLLSIYVILSVFGQLIMITLFQLGALYYVRTRQWFMPNKKTFNDDNVISWESTTVFYISCYQYLILVYICSSGLPHSQPVYKNCVFSFDIFVMTVVTTALLIVPTSPVHNFLRLESIFNHLWRYKLCILLIVALNFIVSSAYEEHFVKMKWLKRLKRKFWPKNRSRPRYKQFNNEDSLDLSLY